MVGFVGWTVCHLIHAVFSRLLCQAGGAMGHQSRKMVK